MTTEGFDRPTADEQLWLANRGEIETVWQAIKITSDCPTAEPLIDVFMDHMAPTTAPPEMRSASLFIKGGNTNVIKSEILKSLGIVAEVLDQESPTRQAAKSLLKTIRPK